MVRRQFISTLFKFGLVSNVIHLLGCENDLDFNHPNSDFYFQENGFNNSQYVNGLQADGNCGTGSHVVQQDISHRHSTFRLTAEQITNANTGLEYHLLGGSHDHSFTITAQQFSELKNGLSITLENHDHGIGRPHVVKVTC